MEKKYILSFIVIGMVGMASAFSSAPCEAPSVFKCAGHSHTCRGTQFSQQFIWDNLKEWSQRNSVAAFGLGSPWSLENAKMTVYYEKEYRDRYYAGQVNPDYKFDAAEVQKTIDEANALGTKTIFYVDNETPKQRYGHVWYVGFKVCVPSWHDYDQGLKTWYSPYDDGKSPVNPVNGKPQQRRSYREVIDEQRAAGALAIWAHPTSWWTSNNDPNGPFTTNIAAEMLPELMEDGYLDGMTVVGYDAFHRDYQALWFALLDLGYRVPGFAELDMSVGHNTTSWDTAFFNLLKNDGKNRFTLDYMKEEYRKARHTMSSGPVVFMSVDGHEQGDEIESGEGKKHLVKVTAFPAKEEKKLSKVELVGRGGETLETVRDFTGGEITFELDGTAEGGYVVVRCFGENDSDYLYKPQQMVRHCALTNPVWLRTDRFRAPAPIKTKRDHMANPKVRELMDYLAEGHFRKDYRVCTPGIVPVKAWRFDEMAKALAE